ncbi:MAG: HDIG domain-containing protein [Desulfobacterales bacterium]
MMEHIAAHSLQVCRVALRIADLLNGREGQMLCRELIEAGALLHDITKTRSLKTGERHAETGAQFLREHGYPEVGELVRQHVRLDHFDFRSSVNEAEIVNYADKRVMHDRIVPLQERMEYIMQRYGTSPELQLRLVQIWQEAKAQERKIFTHIPFAPEELPAYMDSPGCEAEMAEYRMVSTRS